MSDDLLVFAHIGDLHLTTADQDNYRDLQAIVSELAALNHALDFVYLPGDNADNGLSRAIRARRTPARALCRCRCTSSPATTTWNRAGSAISMHSLDAEQLPYAIDAGGLMRCLFLDICGPGGRRPRFPHRC